MKTLGTSGTRSVTRKQAFEILQENRRYFAGFDGFVTGACNGWDTIAGEWFLRTFPESTHYIVVPANRKQVDYWWLKPEIVELSLTLVVTEMPEGTSYRDRNVKIVDLCSELFYCAQFPEKHGSSTRSGTWQTVRLARGKKQVYGAVLYSGK